MAVYRYEIIFRTAVLDENGEEDNTKVITEAVLYNTDDESTVSVYNNMKIVEQLDHGDKLFGLVMKIPRNEDEDV